MRLSGLLLSNQNTANEFSSLAQSIIMSSIPKYRCPICQLALSLNNKTYSCEKNHCFDLAKEGYLNLLPVQHKRSKEPGDNKAMVNARREFLEQGYYQPLIDRLVALYAQYGNSAGEVFDAGCGEGYYTHQHKTNNNNVYGIDIAKEAIKKAAKKYPLCHFSVGTLSHLPFDNDRFDWMVSIYAPILETEFTRVLKQGGYLITVTPAEKHLFELKELVYQQAMEHDTQRNPIKKLQLVAEEKLSYPMMITNGQELLNLLSMTPFAFKASTETKFQLKGLSNFTCQTAFMIRVFQK